MKKVLVLFMAVFLTVGMADSARAVTFNLFDWGFNADGEEISSPNLNAPGDLGAALNATYTTGGFSFTTGLGTVGVKVTGVGAHSVVSWFDHEIDESVNTYFNETGSTSGITAAGQTWEIDEPGWVDGDIYEHLQDTVAAGSFLDDGIGISTHGNTIFPDDVSMALGWDFILGAGESANISFVLSDTVVPSGFYLAHNDPDSLATIYFSSTLEIGSDNPVVPEPSTVILLGIGMAGLVATRKRLGKRFIKG